MTESNLIGIIGSIGAIFAGVFALLKYVIDKNISSQKSFMDYIEKADNLNREYNEKKNGHMERIAVRFDEAVSKFGSKIEGLTEKINEHANFRCSECEAESK